MKKADKQKQQVEKSTQVSDTELLDRLEADILKGVIVWDGLGQFPHNPGHVLGLSLMGGSRSLRDAIKQGTATAEDKAPEDKCFLCGTTVILESGKAVDAVTGVPKSFATKQRDDGVICNNCDGSRSTEIIRRDWMKKQGR